MNLKYVKNDYAGLIAQLAFLNKAKTIVEIGVNSGETTITLCEAAKATKGKVYGFDLWDTHGLSGQFAQSGNEAYVRETLSSCGFDNFELYNKNTFDKDFPLFLDSKVGGSVDLAFIDACHSYKGCLNDFKAVYPILSNTGIVAFHDTQRIDGCREMVYDLRTKFYDGTYDIFDLSGGYENRHMGISFLIKKQFPVQKKPINQICGSPSSPKEIEEKELSLYNKQVSESSGRNNLLNSDPNNLPMSKEFLSSVFRDTERSFLGKWKTK